MKDKNWEDFVEESKKAISMWDDETKFFDAIMDAGAAAKIQGVKFSYREYIKEEQMERFNQRLLFRILLLKKQNEKENEREIDSSGTRHISNKEMKEEMKKRYRRKRTRGRYANE